MKVEAVIFDLGDVLLSVDNVSAMQKLASHAQAPVDSLFNAAELLHRFEFGELTSREFHAEMCRHAELAIGFESFCEIYCDMFSPVGYMIEAHQALREKGLPTYLFSNTSELHFSYISERYDFISQFTGYFLSYKLGCMKPQSASYAAVENGTRRSGSQLLYIDDRRDNVDAAAARGWQVIHHTSAADTLPKLRELGLL